MIIYQIALLFKHIFLLRNKFCMYWLKMFWKNSVLYNFLTLTYLVGKAVFVVVFHKPRLYFSDL